MNASIKIRFARMVNALILPVVITVIVRPDTNTMGQSLVKVSTHSMLITLVHLYINHYPAGTDGD